MSKYFLVDKENHCLRNMSLGSSIPFSKSFEKATARAEELYEDYGWKCEIKIFAYISEAEMYANPAYSDEISTKFLNVVRRY